MLTASSIAWRLALAAALVAVAWAAASIPRLVATEAERTRVALVDAVKIEGERVDRRMAAIQADIALAARHADTHVAQLTASAERALEASSGSAVRAGDVAAETLEAAQALLPSARRTLDQIAENAELLGDCEGNQDCFANRIIPTLRAMEAVGSSSVRIADSVDVAARAVAEVAPKAAGDAAAAVENVQVATGRIAHPFSAVGAALRWFGRKLVTVITLGARR